MTSYLYYLILNPKMSWGLRGVVFFLHKQFGCTRFISLQIFHHYEIQFSFKDSLGEDLSSDPLQNLHVKVMDVKPTEDGT